MMRTNDVTYIGVLILCCCFWSCTQVESPFEKSWYRDFARMGSYSSPRLADLNGDGVLDVVMGGAKKEFEFCDTAVIALNGKTGELMWSASASDQIVGSASFVDITKDGLPDVVIGGRHAELIAIEGHSGRELWRYKTQDDVINTIGYIRFNFYNSQLIPDQNGDGIEDLLLVNGGNVHASPGSTKFRYPGVLAVLSSKDGTVIYAANLPEDKETYMSPLVHDFKQEGNLSIIFATGGETISGNLYIVPLSALQKNDISEAKILLKGEGHGFISPPVLLDLTRDGIRDIVVNYHGGITYAIDGDSHEILWQVAEEGTEANGSLAVGDFNGDDVPDLFTHFNVGVWPNNTGDIQLAINGLTGEIISRDTIGDIGMYSPLAVDMNGNEQDEVLLDVNQYNYWTENKSFSKTAHHIALFNFSGKGRSKFTQIQYCKNLASTPWIGDMDGDQKLDFIYCEMTNTPNFYEFYGLRIQRKATNFPAEKPPAWGAYMGNQYDGIYRQE
ncbi:MAG: hypothetical protein AAF587_12760 [Bacteroidota bacterium]